MSAGSTRRRVEWALGALAVAGLLLPAGSAIATTPGGTPVAPVLSAAPGAPGPAVHPPGLHLGGALGARPLATGEYYTQIGATMAQLNSSSNDAGSPSISFEVTLVNSPYQNAYEINGLSDTGDWYQLVLSDNWPGCNTGFEVGTEVWDAFGDSGPVFCDPTLTLAAGDAVKLGLNFSTRTAAPSVCMDVSDLTRHTSEINCTAQPDPTATEFVVLPGIDNAIGYFTGPMTEIINLTTSDCPDYTVMPSLDYRWGQFLYVTQYFAWSDEFDLVSGTVCYQQSSDLIDLPVGDPQTHYYDTAAGTGYGPHVVAGQNLSVVNSSFGWRVQTDPGTFNVTISADRPIVGINWPTHLTATITGGESPFTTEWEVNGTIEPVAGTSFTFVSNTTGSFRIEFYAVDQIQDVAGPAMPFIVEVVGPLTVLAPTAGPNPNGADVGQTVSFVAHRMGGIPPFSYNWSGLPTGCAGANASEVNCTVQGIGNFSIAVMIADSNGTVLTSPSYPYRISPTPSGTLGLNRTELDAGQELNVTMAVVGGSAPLTVNWGGLPPGCPGSPTTTVTCRPTTAGNYTITVTVTDGNGVPTEPPAIGLRVFPAPTVSITTNRTAPQVGDAIDFVAHPVGGSGVFAYAWSGLPAGCPLGTNASTVACVLTSNGTFSVGALITDSLAGSANASPVAVAVTPRLVATLVVSPGTVHVGDVVDFTTSVSGGTGPYRFSWSGTPPSCFASVNGTFSCEVADTGTFAVTVSVYDTLGHQATAQASLDVSAASSGGALGGLLLPVLGIVVIAVVAAVAALVVLRRRAAAGPSPPASPDGDDQA